jgi:hypothetical protein
MLTKYAFQALFAAALTSSLVSSAHAQDSSIALRDLVQADQPFHSRTCGLVLLSDGRAKVREAAANNAKSLGSARAQLINAFLLLRDGRNLEGGMNAPREYFWQRLSTGTTTSPKNQALPAAVQHCEQWTELRRRSADFDQGPEALDSAQAQTELTIRTE